MNALALVFNTGRCLPATQFIFIYIECVYLLRLRCGVLLFGTALSLIDEVGAVKVDGTNWGSNPIIVRFIWLHHVSELYYFPGLL
jgi:hypothetical protein